MQDTSAGAGLEIGERSAGLVGEDPVAAGNTNATGKVFATDATTQVPTLPHLAERGDVVIH